MKETMRINIWGGPGIGKSTVAAYLFSELKQQRRRIELVTEYVKSWAWEKRVPTSYDQAYIFAKQLRREDILTRHNVDLITDSPLPMQLVYAKKYGCPFYEELMSLCKKFEKDHKSTNLLLSRTVPYQQEGRYETKEEAEGLDRAMLHTLEEYGELFTLLDPTNLKDILGFVARVLREKPSA